jgi:hypothetical protein
MVQYSPLLFSPELILDVYRNAAMLCIRVVVKIIYVQPPTNARSARNPSET